jgi:cell division protein FtsI (penicillin-binding protein 3)
MRSPRVQNSYRRIGIARVLMLLPFLILGLRAAYLSTDQRGRTRGIGQTQRTMTLAAERGAIVDASGVELALSVDSPSVYAIPSTIPDIDSAAAQLAPILGWKTNELAKRLEDHKSFLFLSRWVTSERAKRVSDLGIQGVGLLDESRRIYPHRGLAAELVGFVNIDAAGVRGIEQQEDEWLRGVEQRIPVERDARGRLFWLGNTQPWNTSGGDVALTIDVTLQSAAESALAETVAASGALGGVVVVMDPFSGDVLTLAENPGFDPNQFRKLAFETTRSQAFFDAVDPGSTMKAFLIAAGLETGAIEPGDLFDGDNGSFRVPGKTIRDTHPHGMMTVADIMRVSSNIGAVKIAYQMGASAHYDMLRAFGFGSSTASRFPGESAGLMRSWKSWKPIDHATIAFGQGISVTPIQLASATSALANGGMLVKPRLVSARRTPGGMWHSMTDKAVRRVVSERTAGQVLAMMEGVVGPTGTASRAGLSGVRVAGKTGTAQKWDPQANSFSTDRFVAWFIGVVPADDPKLVVVVAVDEPRRPSHTGGAAAAPLFAKVAAAQLTRFGIATHPERRRALPEHGTPAIAIAGAASPVLPSVSAAASVHRSPTAKKHPTQKTAGSTQKAKLASTREPESNPAAPPVEAALAAKPARNPSSDIVEKLARLNDRVLLPDFLGLTVAEVRQITTDAALSVTISGQGRAVKQEPPPGTVVGVRAGSVRVVFETSMAARPAGDG